jgi:hypothetical protein
MACPQCRNAVALIIGPVFKFRRRRWYDRLTQPRDARQVPGLVKLWAGYDCMCGNPSCATSYRITGRGASVVGAPRRAAPPPPERDDDAIDPDDLANVIPLDTDLLLPGERSKR